MKRQTATQVVGLSLLGMFLLNLVGCRGERGEKGETKGGTTVTSTSFTSTSLSKDECDKKLREMHSNSVHPEELIKWLGKPSRVTQDDGVNAIWHFPHACYDEITGKPCNLQVNVHYKQWGDSKPSVNAFEFNSD